ncbi:NAD-dependent epimerase/dehydratase family protein [Demequina sp.]|uniref:NAD-dependent epimerase/dehydratase family protein n=1 Tax=Demequina sp. TaxID=2050685 RepID=UPI003D145333
MRIFVAGATGAIGRFLVPLLAEAGHEVAGLTRSADKAPALVEAGAVPVVCDVYDPRLIVEMAEFAPDLVINQITDLPQHQAMIALKVRELNRARTEGMDALIHAARTAGASRFIAQSVAFSAPAPVRKAVEHLERSTLEYPGVVLRYGYFFGPGTWYPEGTKHEPRVHVELAAIRTVELLDAEPGVYEIVDPA